MYARKLWRLVDVPVEMRREDIFLVEQPTTKISYAYENTGDFDRWVATLYILRTWRGLLHRCSRTRHEDLSQTQQTSQSVARSAVRRFSASPVATWKHDRTCCSPLHNAETS